MAVQVGRTVISFTIKYVQSEKEKLKNEVSKLLESKNKLGSKANPMPKSSIMPEMETELNIGQQNKQ
jgi:hypothetical protein